MINNLADTFRRVFKNIYESLKEEEIRIVKKGNRITTAYYVDGKCARHANAKCSKEDKFNFEYGSKLAFKRMWGDPDA